MHFTLPAILVVLPVVATACLCFTYGRRHRVRLANIAEGVHGDGILSKRADAAVPRYRLLKVGSDADHVALAGAGELALYQAIDEAAAAEDLIGCRSLACGKGTVLMVSNGAGVLVPGDLLVPAATGKVAKKAAAAGNYYIAGIAITGAAATDGELIEVIPIGAWQTNA